CEPTPAGQTSAPPTVPAGADPPRHRRSDASTGFPPRPALPPLVPARRVPDRPGSHLLPPAGRLAPGAAATGTPPAARPPVPHHAGHAASAPPGQRRSPRHAVHSAAAADA